MFLVIGLFVFGIMLLYILLGSIDNIEEDIFPVLLLSIMIPLSFTSSGYLYAKQELLKEEKAQNKQISKEYKEELKFDTLTIYIKRNDHETNR